MTQALSLSTGGITSILSSYSLGHPSTQSQLRAMQEEAVAFICLYQWFSNLAAHQSHLVNSLWTEISSKHSRCHLDRSGVVWKSSFFCEQAWFQNQWSSSTPSIPLWKLLHRCWFYSKENWSGKKKVVGSNTWLRTQCPSCQFRVLDSGFQGTLWHNETSSQKEQKMKKGWGCGSV